MIIFLCSGLVKIPRKRGGGVAEFLDKASGCRGAERKDVGPKHPLLWEKRRTDDDKKGTNRIRKGESPLGEPVRKGRKEQLRED